MLDQAHPSRITSISLVTNCNVHGNKHLLVIFTHHSRLHTGAAGENAAEFTSTCVHITDAFSISSKSKLQV